jgi:hypothetical protein
MVIQEYKDQHNKVIQVVLAHQTMLAIVLQAVVAVLVVLGKMLLIHIAVLADQAILGV